MRRALLVIAIASALLAIGPGAALAVQVTYGPGRYGGTDLVVSDPSGVDNRVTITNGPGTPNSIQHIITDTSGVSSASPSCEMVSPTRASCSISEAVPPSTGSFGEVAVDLGAGNDFLDMSSLVPARSQASATATVFAGPGNDQVLGATGRDVIRGGGGRDSLLGNGGSDDIRGNSGGDRLLGGLGDDALAGGAGDDRLSGGPGRDRLIGGGGFDRCFGGSGLSRLIGCEVHR